MYVITGRNLLGVVAKDETEFRWKADQIAKAWRDSGLNVQIEETGVEENDHVPPVR